MLTIAFLQENHNHAGYTGASLRSGGIGGTESSVIHLAEALAARGHTVFGLNRLDGGSAEAGVTWLPLSEKPSLPPLDAAVGINSTRIFDGIRARGKISWLHNPPTLRQQLKRRHLVALLRHRPHAVLLGRYQSGLLPSWLPYRGRSLLAHGVGGEFFSAGATEPRRRRAVFTSQPKRGLDFVAKAWSAIAATVPDAELHVFCPQAREREAAAAAGSGHGIVIRGSVSRADLAKELKQARAMLIPGVSDETFCLAAAEATAAGVPIVTRGAGALSERVVDGQTGFLAPEADRFAAATIRLLTDDALWLQMNAACVASPDLAPWPRRALEWEALFQAIGL